MKIELDITDKKVNEIEEISKEHPDGYLKSKNGKTFWVYELKK
jgi:hypothetical protein